MGYSMPPTDPHTEPDPNNPFTGPNPFGPPASPRQHRMARRLLLWVALPLAAVLAFAILITLVASPSPAPIVVAPPTVSAAPLAPVPTLPPPDVPARPANTFAAGIHEVGNGSGQMSPGKYHSDGPGQGVTGYCYYARLSATDGQDESIIANVNTLGPATVTVKPTDAAFEIQGDCVFAKVS
jgi:hypothetical protein